MRRIRLLPVAAFVVLAFLMLASCSESLTSTSSTSSSSTSSSGSWWQRSGASSCGEAAMYRIDSGTAYRLGNCLMLLSANSAPNINIRRGEQVEIHVESRYSVPVSSDTSVLDLSGRSDGDATSTFVAKSGGTVMISVRGPCIEDPNNNNGTCLVLQVTVS